MGFTRLHSLQHRPLVYGFSVTPINRFLKWPLIRCLKHYVFSRIKSGSPLLLWLSRLAFGLWSDLLSMPQFLVEDIPYRVLPHFVS